MWCWTSTPHSVRSTPRTRRTPPRHTRAASAVIRCSASPMPPGRRSRACCGRATPGPTTPKTTWPCWTPPSPPCPPRSPPAIMRTTTAEASPGGGGPGRLGRGQFRLRLGLLGPTRPLLGHGPHEYPGNPGHFGHRRRPIRLAAGPTSKRQDPQGSRGGRGHCIPRPVGLAPGDRLIIRREPLHPGAQQSLFPDLEYRYVGLYTDQEGRPVALDVFHRAHAHVEDAIAWLRDSGLERYPFTSFVANAAW